MDNETFIKKVQQLGSTSDIENAKNLIRLSLEFFGDEIAFATSFGAEDQVITDLLFSHSRTFRIFTLDTGRLPQETCNVFEETRKRYGISIKILFPDTEQVESMVNEHGPNLFYDSVEKRKLCCRLRKIEPLKRELSGLKAWICGLRKEQSVTRSELNAAQWDEGNGLVRICPLANWTTQQVWEYIRNNNLPYNKLHDNGYPSIGCAPCTRAVKDGEDIRAGRWWWELPEHKECGLHLHRKVKG